MLGVRCRAPRRINRQRIGEYDQLELPARGPQGLGPPLGDQKPHRVLTLVASAAQSHAGVLGQPGANQGVENQRSSMRISEVEELTAEGHPDVRDLAGHTERAKRTDGIAIGKLRAHPDKNPSQSGMGQGLPEPVRTVSVRPEPPDLRRDETRHSSSLRPRAAEHERTTAHTVKLIRQLPEQSNIPARGNTPPLARHPDGRLLCSAGSHLAHERFQAIRNRNHWRGQRHRSSIPVRD